MVFFTSFEHLRPLKQFLSKNTWVKFGIERLSSLVHDSFTQTFGVVGEDIQSKVTFYSSENIKSKIKFYRQSLS